jgi:hypothetical protein
MEAAAPDGGVPSIAAPAAAPVQPVVAPTPAAVAPIPEPAKVSPQLNYTDPASKQVGTMLSDAGVDPLKARDAITANGGQVTPEIYAALSAKHGEGMASLLAGQMSKLHDAGIAKGTEKDNAVYAQVKEAFKGISEQSGQETWAELSGWAKDNIDNDQRKDINAAIAQGGFVAQLAVQELVNAFQQSGDYSQDMIGIEGDNVPNAPTGGDLTRQEYNTQLDALIAKGHVYGQSKEINTLQARRTRSAQRSL